MGTHRFGSPCTFITNNAAVNSTEVKTVRNAN